MADRIKGITVEIGGDTTGLSKALSGVNKEIKSTQSQLKDVNKLLKLDPTNTALLEQKQKLLQQAVSETKEKLTQLKSVQDQMDAGLKNGTVTQQQYDAWQREIIETENELKNLEQQCRETDTSITATLRATGSKLQEVGGKISDVGTSLSTHVTAPIVAIGAASIAAFNEVDAGLDIVAQKTGATGDELEDMCQIVKDLATEIPTDFETAGAAVGEVNTRFGLTGQALDDLSAKFIKFAQLNDTDVSTSIDNVSSVMNAFGMDASEADNLLDALNATGQATGIDMDTLANALSSNAAQLKEMGLTAQQAAGFMGMVEMSGLECLYMDSLCSHHAEIQYLYLIYTVYNVIILPFHSCKKKRAPFTALFHVDFLIHLSYSTVLQPMSLNFFPKMGQSLVLHQMPSQLLSFDHILLQIPMQIHNSKHLSE